MSTLAAIRDAYVKDMRWAVYGIRTVMLSVLITHIDRWQQVAFSIRFSTVSWQVGVLWQVGVVRKTINRKQRIGMVSILVPISYIGNGPQRVSVKDVSRATQEASRGNGTPRLRWFHITAASGNSTQAGEYAPAVDGGDACQHQQPSTTTSWPASDRPTW